MVVGKISVNIKAKISLWYKCLLKLLEVLVMIRVMSGDRAYSIAERLMDRAIKVRVGDGVYRPIRE